MIFMKYFTFEMIEETFCLKFHEGGIMCLCFIIEDEVVDLLLSTKGWLL